MMGGGLADGDKVVIADRIDDRESASRRRFASERRKRLAHRILGRNGAGLEGDDARLAVLWRSLGRHADELDRRHAAFCQSIGEVARAGEIVGDAAEQHYSTSANGLSRPRTST